MSELVQRENVHISYNLPTVEHHRIVAKLALKYTKNGGSVLDIGCGLGHILELIKVANTSLQLYAIDTDQYCLEITRNKITDVETILMAPSPRIDLQNFYNKFDTCIMSHSLEHMLSPVDTINDVMKCLKPNGVLILAVPNPIRPQVILNSILKKKYANKGHVYSWDRAHWINFLENIMKLQVIDYPNDEVKLFPQKLSASIPLIKYFEYFVSRIFPWFSFSNVAIIRK